MIVLRDTKTWTIPLNYHVNNFSGRFSNSPDRSVAQEESTNHGKVTWLWRSLLRSVRHARHQNYHPARRTWNWRFECKYFLDSDKFWTYTSFHFMCRCPSCAFCRWPEGSFNDQTIVDCIDDSSEKTEQLIAVFSPVIQDLFLDKMISSYLYFYISFFLFTCLDLFVLLIWSLEKSFLTRRMFHYQWHASSKTKCFF